MFSKIAVLCGVAGVASAQNNEAKHNVANVVNPILPHRWSSLKEVHSSTSLNMADMNSTAASGYLVANMYFGSDSCSVPKSGVYATATGVCFLGVDSTGQTLGSIVYNFGGVDNNRIQMYTSVFESYDCTGKYTTSSWAAPTNCFPDTDNVNSYLYSFTTNAQPWTTYDPGLLFGYYGTAESCSAEDTSVGGVYGWYGINTCLPATQSDGTEVSTAFTACAGGLYTQTIYADNKCKEFHQAVTSKLMHCQKSNDDSSDSEDMSPSKQYESFFCTGA